MSHSDTLAAARAFVILIAFIHTYIFIFETFLWKSRAPKIFGMSPSKTAATVMMAANQGIYNLTYVAGLIIGIIMSYSNKYGGDCAVFVLTMICSFIFTVGIFGAVTVSNRILFVQVIPSFIAILLLQFAYKSDNSDSQSDGESIVLTIVWIIIAGIISGILGWASKKNAGPPPNEGIPVGDA